MQSKQGQPIEKIRVMVIEDDQDDLARLITSLEKAGCFDITSFTSIEGIDIAQQISQHSIDVVSLDLELEESWSLILVKRLRNIDPTLGIGIVTHHPVVKPYIQEEVDFFLVKPVAEEQLIGSVKNSALLRILSILGLELGELLRLRLDPLSDTSTTARLLGLAAKLAVLVEEDRLLLEASKCRELIGRLRQFLSSDSNLKPDWHAQLKALCSMVDELRERVLSGPVLDMGHEPPVESMTEGQELISPQESVQEQHVRRYTDVLFPEECVLGEKVTLAIQLKINVDSDNKESCLDTKKEVQLLVLISGQAFSILERAKIMTVPYDRNSTKVEFTMAPRRLGEQAISIEFFKGAARIGYIIATTFVESGD